MIQVSEWSVLLLLLKLASYSALAALAGTFLIRFIIASNLSGHHFISFSQYLKRWQIQCVALGFIAVILQVPIEAGAIAESGVAGMLDPFMQEIVWQSVIGEQALFRGAALFVAMIVALNWRINIKHRFAVVINNTVMLVLLISIAYSFTFTGHSANENGLVKSILTFHLLAIASWVGSLWPLYKSCTILSVHEVKKVMHLFGHLAIIVVFVLLISGLALLLNYLHSLSALFTSSYGQLILLKLLLVSAMLMMGAWHKLILVPRITQKQHVGTLKRSISVEMLIAAFVLITTSVFTTLVGPPN
ncbi:hypothetical protein LCGC14_2010760 [marine sediment metagenome]|jgi:putative copper resistance protein D|uniref:Copper resistance protein D domain-containing protein n=3 Tax=root TaxID=1 RepID=A0A0F9HXM9_9ZZZZ